jgi:hypothetical protein
MNNLEENKNEGSGQEAKPNRKFYFNMLGQIKRFEDGLPYDSRVDGDLKGAEIVDPVSGLTKYIFGQEKLSKLEAAADSQKSAEPQYWNKVKQEAERLGIKVDPANARESRLEVALALHEKGDMKAAISIMQAAPFGTLEIDRRVWAPYIASMGFEADYLAGKTTPRKFYSGFANIDRT